MDEAESSPSAFRRKKLTLWPSIVVLASFFAWWVFFYWDIFSFLLLIAMLCFSAAWLIYFLVLMLRRRPRKALSFLIPALAAFALPLLFAAGPLVQSRHYVEFLMYDARYHIKAEVRKNGYTYERWPLPKGSMIRYEIVYDATDGILRKDMINDGVCFTKVFRVGEHFYIFAESCP